MYQRKRDLSNQRFGMLIALRPNGKDGKKVLWFCRCDCGKEATVRGANLTASVRPITSCGCKRGISHRSADGVKREAHGMRDTTEYKIWSGMIQRCYNPSKRGYENYGGRGITVCDLWRGSFLSFLSHVGMRPSDLFSIDRINNEKGYEPGNVKWSTRLEQANNTRRNKKKYI